MTTKTTLIVRDAMLSLKAGDVKIEGHLGKRIDCCIENGVMAVPYETYVVPFRNKTDDRGDWGGEFFGKWHTSASLAYRYRPEEAFEKVINDAIHLLKSTVEPNGRLSACHEDFANWDLWGRKYALLALLTHYKLTGEDSSLEIASKVVDQLLTKAGPGKKRITDTGLRAVDSLSSSSILEPIALLYQYNPKPHYLDFARHIVKLWSEPTQYSPDGMRLVEAVLEGEDTIYISAPKAYEMLSCYEGLCELYRATGEKAYLDTVIRFAEKVSEKEIMITGSASSCELWCDGTVRQTERLENPMETCVTVTWYKLCYKLLCITGESRWADLMENTLYNALLGAMMVDGTWWGYYSPLSGKRKKSNIQMSYIRSSCCVANGPRGLLTTPLWAVMKDMSGIVVNLFNDADIRWKDKEEEFRLRISGGYPKSGNITITLNCPSTRTFAIRLRIPSWSKKTSISFRGEEITVKPGNYFVLERAFQNKDRIKVSLDMRGRIVNSPGSVNYKAVMSGPVVLACDRRLTSVQEDLFWVDDGNYREVYDPFWNHKYFLLNAVTKKDETRYIDLKPCASKPDDIWIAYDVPFYTRPNHFKNHRRIRLTLCDYSSAGNDFTRNSSFKVWLSQPSSSRDIYP